MVVSIFNLPPTVSVEKVQTYRKVYGKGGYNERFPVALSPFCISLWSLDSFSFDVLYIITIILFHNQIVPYLAFVSFWYAHLRLWILPCFVAQLYVTALDSAPDLVSAISPRSPSVFSREWYLQAKNLILLLLGLLLFCTFWTDILSL